MQLTQIHCRIFRGPDASSDTSSYVALNPERKPGSLVIAGASAAKASIGSQVACRLAMEHFVDGVMEHCADKKSTVKKGGQEPSIELLEAGFKKANTSVYNFGHKLAAGGRMASSLLGLTLDSGSVAIGRVGDGAAFLYRDRELFPFLEKADVIKPDAALDGLIGGSSLVSVQLASVALKPHDTVILFARGLVPGEEAQLLSAVAGVSFEYGNPPEDLARGLLSDYRTLPYLALVQVGPEAMFLPRLSQFERAMARSS